MKKQTGFPTSLNPTGEFQVVRIRNSKMKRVRSIQSFCILATPEENEAGLYGVVEHFSGDLDEVLKAARHASWFGDIYIVEEISSKYAVAEFDNGEEVKRGSSHFAN